MIDKAIYSRDFFSIYEFSVSPTWQMEALQFDHKSVVSTPISSRRSLTPSLVSSLIWSLWSLFLNSQLDHSYFCIKETRVACTRYQSEQVLFVKNLQSIRS